MYHYSLCLRIIINELNEIFQDSSGYLQRYLNTVKCLSGQRSARRHLKKLREVIIRTQILAFFDRKKDIVVETDVSDWILARLVLQHVDNEVIHTIAFYSKYYLPVEVNNEIYDKKLMTIVREFMVWPAELVSVETLI